MSELADIISMAPEGATHYSPEFKDCRDHWWFKRTGCLYVWVGSWVPTNYASTEMVPLSDLSVTPSAPR